MNKYLATLLAIVIFLTGSQALAQSLDELLASADPFGSLPTLKLKKLVEDLEPLESGASVKQQQVIDLFKMRHLAIQGEYEAALALLQKLDTASAPPDIRVRAYTIASSIYHITGDYLLAFQTLNKIQQLLPWIKNDTLRYIASSMAAELYMDTGDLDKALKYALLEKTAALGTGKPINICSSYDGVGGVYYKRNELVQSAREYTEMIVACKSIPAPLFTAAGYNGRGMALEKQGRFEEAIKNFKTAQKLYLETGYQYGLGSSLLNQASSYFALGKTKEAEAYLKQALPLIESSGLQDMLKEAYGLKSKLTEAQQDYKAALTWYKRKASVEKQIIDNRKALRIAQLQVEFEVGNKEQHIEQLKQQNQLLALQKQTSHQRYLITILGLLILALIAVLFWIKAQRERSHFKHMSQVDPLTGLYNHAYCYALAEKGFHECLARKRPFTVVVADIDWFKYVNDTYGHAAGDKVLKHIAAVLKNCLGKNGVVGRTGGEEFTCFLPEMDLGQARLLVENCRRQIQPVVDYGKSIEVTLSYGLAQSLGGYQTLDTLVRDADEALYKAKRNGRNQVLTYTPVDRSGAS
ncbi:tetratricopeptide repeat-containing diguanylate cyclase [Thiolapillus brandeum]|uniref:diguanylate cyclase n=1 Tax=Thiolapillus brandeum TaxID=1076588 RepID=A0A7U6JHY4_9GAMM|nr:diguanylate cyclase [Thiolapillus brandeum]BAO44781.1 hypothetical protein TBH_C1866 [Thiolapillus brandeum]